LKLNFSYNYLTYVLIFTTLCSLVHANFSILPPFYPLFSISVAGIYWNFEKIKYLLYVEK
jgi:hypothetical protein